MAAHRKSDQTRAYLCAAPARSDVRSASERSALPKTLRRKAAVNPLCVKYWETIADNLKKAGWSWGCVSALDTHGRLPFALAMVFYYHTGQSGFRTGRISHGNGRK